MNLRSLLAALAVGCGAVLGCSRGANDSHPAPAASETASPASAPSHAEQATAKPANATSDTPPVNAAPAAAPASTSDTSTSAPAAPAISQIAAQDGPPAAAPKDPPAGHFNGDGHDSATESSPRPNEPLFKNWPKPLAVVVATGMQMGYVEPCGCSGRENQKGGLSRRFNLLKKLRTDGWDVVPVDVGGQIERYGKQSELKFQSTIDALKAMHYRAVALGTDDLRLPADVLLAAVADVDPENPSPFVSANVGVFDFDQVPRFRAIKAGKMTIGVTAVLGESERKQINSAEIKSKPADEALKEVLPQLEAAKCDQLVLLAHATKAEAAELAKKFPQFGFIVVAYGAAIPPREPEILPDTKTRLIEIGEKGMAANVIGFFDDPQTPVRFQTVALDARFDKMEIAGKTVGPPDEMKQSLASYQDQLKLLGLAGLNVKPAAHPSGNQFVGSKTCGECHTKVYAVWEKTPHAHALDTLEKQSPPRQYDPECLSCHVTGWSPQKFYPFKGGYESVAKTPQLAQNGCENCHGPGSAHVAAENGNVPTGQTAEELRAAMRVPATAKTCIECHDGDNSIHFDFDTYWPKVVHKGKN